MAKNPLIDEYIAAQSPETQEILKKIREIILEETPESVTECMMHNMPSYKMKRYIAHFAPFKKHIGFYPGADAIDHFVDRLEGYKLAKGTVQLPLNKDMPYDLVRDLVRFNVKREKQI